MATMTTGDTINPLKIRVELDSAGFERKADQLFASLGSGGVHYRHLAEAAKQFNAVADAVERIATSANLPGTIAKQILSSARTIAGQEEKILNERERLISQWVERRYQQDEALAGR